MVRVVLCVTSYMLRARVTRDAKDFRALFLWRQQKRVNPIGGFNTAEGEKIIKEDGGGNPSRLEEEKW